MDCIGRLLPLSVLMFVLTAGAAAQTQSCSQVQLFSSQPMSRLAQPIRMKLRHAVQPGIQAILNNKGMGFTDKAPTISLAALPIGPATESRALYIVSWDDSSFGVNGFNWIVELTPHGATNLMSARAAKVSGGFGGEMLGAPSERYPAIMIASKGYKDGGGADAEESCFQKTGSFYEPAACPITCHDELNR